MSSSILNVTFDCTNGESLARFWSAAVSRPWSKVDMPGNPFWVVGNEDGGATRLVFVQVPERKGAKNRVHLDLQPADTSQADEVARLEALGAKIVDDRHEVEPGGWVVMADPEGNEFCVEVGLPTS